jgi:hypothetical protein
MGFLDKLFAGGGAVLIGVVARSLYKDAQETKRRRNSPLRFDEGLSQREFLEISRDIAKRTPRAEGVAVNGMTVKLLVRSISGLSTWTAEIDFNDYGHLTGEYWLSTPNSDSLIPEHFANAVKSQIESRVSRNAGDHWEGGRRQRQARPARVRRGL